jgi:hypothetical protein
VLAGGQAVVSVFDDAGFRAKRSCARPGRDERFVAEERLDGSGKQTCHERRRVKRIDLRIIGTMQSCVARGALTRFVAKR